MAGEEDWVVLDKAGRPKSAPALTADDTSQATADWVVLDKAGNPKAAAGVPTVDQSYLAGLARTAVGQGTFLGFGDELMAALRTASGEKWGDAIADERAKVAAFRKDNWKAALLGELVGGVVTPGVGLVTGAIRPAASTLRTIGRGAKLGAAFGYAGGLGAAEGNLLERQGEALKGAGLGATVGAAIPAVGAMVGGGIDRARQAVSPTLARRHGIEAAADEVLANKMARAGVTPQAIADDLARGQQAAQFARGKADLPEVLADAHPSLQRLAGSVHRAGAEDVQTVISNRQSGSIADFSRNAETGGQFERLREQMRLSLGASNTDLADQIATIQRKRSKEADRMFSAARAASEPFDLSPTLTRYAFEAMDRSDPRQRAVIVRAIKYFDPDGSIGKPAHTVFPVNDVKRFQRAKEALDDLIDLDYVQSQKHLRSLLREMRGDLMEAVFRPNAKGEPTINAPYRKALDRFASRSALIDAAKAGQDFARGTEPITDRMWRAMSEAEKKMARRAWLEHQAHAMGEKAAGPTSDFTGALRKANTADELRMIMPPTAGSDDVFKGGNRERLGELVRREHRMSGTAAEVLGNSKTAQRAQDDIELAGRDMLGQTWQAFRTSGGLVNLGLDAVSIAAERAFGFRDDMAKALARRLVAADPAEQQRILQRIAARMGQRRVESFLDLANGVAPVAVSGAAGATGRAVGAEGADRERRRQQLNQVREGR